MKISITNKIKENYIVALRLRSHRVITQAIDGYRYILQRIITHPHRAAANMAEELFFASLHPMRRTQLVLVDGWWCRKDTCAVVVDYILLARPISQPVKSQLGPARHFDWRIL